MAPRNSHAGPMSRAKIEANRQARRRAQDRRAQEQAQQAPVVWPSRAWHRPEQQAATRICQHMFIMAGMSLAAAR